MGIQLSVSAREGARVAIVSKDISFTGGLSHWLGSNDPQLAVVLAVTSWGDLLHDREFPTDLVVLDAASSKRNSVESRVRTLRASGTAVLVMTAAGTGDDPQRAVSAGAFCVLEKSVPLGLIDEMARGAVGLPIVHTR
jgi:DNA-binding NarL/FixJ family response regulator